MSRQPVLHSSLPVRPWADPMAARLPGMQVVRNGHWLIRDEMFAGQMALRDQLLAERRAEVFSTGPDMEPASRAALAAVMKAIARDPDYRLEQGQVIRPDGVAVNLRVGDPLIVAARLVQEDLLLLLPGQTEHELRAGVLCFPASWTLQEKIGRTLTSIHSPVPRYTANVAGRVQRVASNLRPGEPVWRANAFRYNSPHLFHPRKERNPRAFDPDGACYIRVERQTLMQLERADALLFAIHTYMAPAEVLSPEDMRAMLDWMATH